MVCSLRKPLPEPMAMAPFSFRGGLFLRTYVLSAIRHSSGLVPTHWYTLLILPSQGEDILIAHSLTRLLNPTAVQNLDPSHLLTMDSNYSTRIAYRKRIMAESPQICIGVNNDTLARPAVRELYTFLLGTYLPKRYPSMFKLHYASFESGSQFMFENLITKQVFPTQPASTTPTETLLQTLGATLDEDFLFLLPESESDSADPKYVLEAYICICPSGWNPTEKLGKRLAVIHWPVPGYSAKLEGSMDRYFKALEVGKYVQRSNWAITQREELFMPDPNSNHGKEGSEQKAVESIDPEKVSITLVLARPILWLQ